MEVLFYFCLAPHRFEDNVGPERPIARRESCFDNVVRPVSNAYFFEGMPGCRILFSGLSYFL